MFWIFKTNREYIENNNNIQYKVDMSISLKSWKKIGHCLVFFCHSNMWLLTDSDNGKKLQKSIQATLFNKFHQLFQELFSVGIKIDRQIFMKIQNRNIFDSFVTLSFREFIFEYGFNHLNAGYWKKHFRKNYFGRAIYRRAHRQCDEIGLPHHDFQINCVYTEMVFFSFHICFKN